MGVHPEARGGVDLDDGAAGLTHGRGDVRADEVDAGHIEADDARRGLGDLDVVGVCLDGPVDGRAAGRHVAGQRELDPGPRRQDVIEGEPLRRDERLGRVVDLDPGQHLLVADASPRIAVGDVHELADGVFAVSRDGRGHALGDGRDLAADHQAAVVVARHVGLDDHVAGAALRQCPDERGSDRLLRAQVEMDAPTVVAVERLDHAREPEPLGGGDRAVLGVHDVGARHRQPGRIEQPVGQALVRGDIDPDGRRLRGHRRADPLLVDAVAELHERVSVEPDERDVAADRLVDERLGGRPERLPFGEPDEVLHLRGEVEEGVGIVGRGEVVDQGDRHPAGFQPDRLFAVLVDAVVLADGSGGARLAVADVRAGEVLEFERHVLGDVAGPRPLAEARDEAAATAQRAGVVLERRQQRDQRVGEPRKLVRWVRLENAKVDEQADDRFARPVVRAAQHAGLEDPQRGRRPTRGGLPRAPAATPRVAAGCGSAVGHAIGHGSSCVG